MTYLRLTEKQLKDLSKMVDHLSCEVQSLRLDMRHIQDQTTDYNTRLVNLALKLDKCINNKED